MTFLLSVGTLLDQDKVIDNQRVLGDQQQAVENIESRIKTFTVELTSEAVSKIEIANRRARKFVEMYGLTSTSEDFKSRTCVEPIISIGQGSFIKTTKIMYLIYLFTFIMFFFRFLTLSKKIQQFTTIIGLCKYSYAKKIITRVQIDLTKT